MYLFLSVFWALSFSIVSRNEVNDFVLFSLELSQGESKR